MRRRAGLTLGNSRPGLIDIGSHSVRLVIFEGYSRAFIPLFNEKSLPALGRGLEKTGHLHPAGKIQALEAIRRFCTLAEAMGVPDLTLLATAAIRDAADGKALVAEIARLTGKKVQILSGEEEARYSAFGVIAGNPEALGIMGDLGGGSLELVAIGRERITEHATLPLGPLRLIDRTGGKLADARAMIDRELGKLPWLQAGKGKSFYPVGGTWRSLAKIHMAYAHYPLHLIHEYRMNRRQVESLVDLLGHVGRKTLGAITEINQKRADTLPYGALIMERLLRIIEPKDIVFSAYGLREGYIFTQLAPEEQRQDPLLAGCRDLAQAQGRFQRNDEALFAWLSPVFGEAGHRLLRAAALLSDISWREHPDYRAEHAFLRVLRAPIGGVSHRERAILSLALASRYGAPREAPFASPAVQLLEEADLRFAGQMGRALRLAYSLTGGSKKLLEATALRRAPNRLLLDLPPAWRPLYGESVGKRLEALGRAFELEVALTGPGAPEE